MKTIKIYSQAGSFAEDKDIARDLRIKEIEPYIRDGQDITLDFKGVDGATQSFIHALLSDVIRKTGSEVIEKFHFKNCNDTVKKIIEIVVDYMQESI